MYVGRGKLLHAVIDPVDGQVDGYTVCGRGGETRPRDPRIRDRTCKECLEKVSAW